MTTSKQACGKMFNSTCSQKNAHLKNVVALYTYYIRGILEIIQYYNTVVNYSIHTLLVTI